MIDSHCHLHYDYAPKGVDTLISEARDAGVSHLVTVGVDLDTMDAIQKTSERFDNVVHTVGVHPHEATTLSDEGLERLRKAAAHPKCRAIGEVGLDYYYEHSPREAQMQWMERQLDLAVELGLPVVIHGRDAEADLLSLLTPYAKKSRTTKERPFVGALHCFTASYEFGKACLDLGFVISFSGILTFKTASDLRISAQKFPLDRLMVETDSPYLAPIPMRGKRCEPAMVLHTARVLADVKGVELAELDRVTSATTRSLFNF